MNKIGIIIPTYNEGEEVFKLVEEINKNISFVKIIIIDDSYDSKIKDINSRFKNVIYVNRKRKLGRGSAVILGLKSLIKIGVKIFIEMDADYSHRPGEIKKNIKIFKKKKLDLLISSRYLKKSKIINWPLKRRLFSKASNLLARFLLKIPITDYTNGFRIYSVRAANNIVRKCGKIGDGFIILSEIIVVLYLKKFKIDETPTIFINRKRGESSVNLRLIFSSFIGLIRIYVKKLLTNDSR